VTSSPALVGNDKKLCSFCARGEYLATLQKLSQRKAEYLVLCSQVIEAACSMRRGFSFSRRGLRIRETRYYRCCGSRRRNGKLHSLW